MTIQTSYNELWKPADAPLTATLFPDKCPCCGANIEEESDGFNGHLYSCGGQYRMKPQIQNHTDKYWGYCPENKMKQLKATALLDSDAVVWAVKENSERRHVASFSHGFIAENFAKSFSSDYPRFWDDDSKIVYIEVLGDNGFGSDGQRYYKGNMIAKKSVPHHIKGAGTERQWFKVTQVNSYTYKDEQELID